MKPIRLMAAFFTVGIWTMLSRVLGFVRDIMIAGFLGTGPVAEAFMAAFTMPNLFRRFFAEGAFNMAFVPMFSKKLEAEDGAKEFAQDAFVVMAFFLTFFSVLAILAMPALVTVLAGGFRGDERFDLAVTYGRCAFPYILFISLAALLSGVLNATGRFAAAAAAPVFLNIVLVAGMVIASRFGGERAIGWGLTFAVPIAGIVQLALVWWSAKRAGFALMLGWPKWTPDLKRLAVIAAPAALAGGVLQINLLVGRLVSSFFEGAVAWLSYADRLYQLPLGVVGIAIGVVLLPDLSRKLQAGDTDGGQDAFSRAGEISLALTIPAAVALLVVPAALISVMFERGAFTASDTAATALAVAVYGLGLPAFVLQKTLQPLFFAREDTRRPFKYAVVAMILNAVVSVGLAPFVGYIAAAVGTTLTGWAMVVLLWRGSRGMGKAAEFDARFWGRIWKIVAASFAMGIVLWGVQIALADYLLMPTVRYAALAVLVISGIVSYFAIGQIIGAFRLSEFRAALRR